MSQIIFLSTMDGHIKGVAFCNCCPSVVFMPAGFDDLVKKEMIEECKILKHYTFKQFIKDLRMMWIKKEYKLIIDWYMKLTNDNQPRFVYWTLENDKCLAISKRVVSCPNWIKTSNVLNSTSMELKLEKLTVSKMLENKFCNAQIAFLAIKNFIHAYVKKGYHPKRFLHVLKLVR